MDVFSDFDDHNFNSFVRIPLWGFRCCIAFFLILSKVWVKNNQVFSIVRKFVSLCFNVIKIRGKGLYLTGFPLVIIRLALIIFPINLSRVTPYLYCVRSQLCFGLTFASSIWVSILCSSLLCSYVRTLALLVPRGCPAPIISGLVLLEVVAYCLQPLTLVIRLGLNIGAGKVILTLLRDALLVRIYYLGVNGMVVSIFIFFGGVVFSAAEIAVARIQTYIFFSLLCLYTGSHSE